MFQSSLYTLVFFILIVIIYYLVSHKYRWILLLFSSYYFIFIALKETVSSWQFDTISSKLIYLNLPYIPEEVIYLFILFFTTLFTYYSGKKISQMNDMRKKGFLIFSLILIILPLFYIKYFMYDVFKVD